MKNEPWEPSDKAEYERYVAEVESGVDCGISTDVAKAVIDECAILYGENYQLRQQQEMLRRSAYNWCEEAARLNRQRASLLSVIAGMVLAGTVYFWVSQ